MVTFAGRSGTFSPAVRAGRELTAGLNPGQVTRGHLDPPIHAACTHLDQRLDYRGNVQTDLAGT